MRPLGYSLATLEVGQRVTIDVGVTATCVLPSQQAHFLFQKYYDNPIGEIWNSVCSDESQTGAWTICGTETPFTGHIR